MLVYKFSFQLSYLQNYGVTKYSNHYLFLEILLIVCNVLIINANPNEQNGKRNKLGTTKSRNPKMKL